VSLVDEAGGGLDGLSQLRVLIASGRTPGILVALDGKPAIIGPLVAYIDTRFFESFSVLNHPVQY
jgi:hypothetical protein